MYKNVLIVTVILSTGIDAFFGNSLKKLKQKAKNIYQSKFGKDKTWHFLGQDPNEYPGTNAQSRNVNKQKWEEYYLCLRVQNENLGQHLSVTPEAVMSFEGSSINLECKICLSPSERENADAVEWEWAPKDSNRLEPIDVTEHILISPEDKTLHLYNLQTDSTGQYKCSLGQSITAPYFLTIFNSSDSDFLEVHSSEAPVGPYPQKPEKINGYDLNLDTEWGPWSTCSKCSQIGRKHKLGYCAIYLKSDNDLTLPELSNTSQADEETTERIEITADDLELLKIFKYGIPCNSHILPKSIREIKQIKERKNEIMTGYCKVKCPQEKIFEVQDKDGNIIEKANNSAGVYSILQGLPPLEPPIERRLQYDVKGKTVVLACPGNLNTDAPIQWQIAEQNIIPEIISKESKGRIYISITDKIHIKNAKISDSNIYSCWQHKELAGTIRLVVEKKFEMNFNHHLMLIGIIIILSTFLLVCVKAFFGRKYAKVTIKTPK